MAENSGDQNTEPKRLNKEEMSRRKAAQKRKILPDPKFGNLKVAKFMNQIMTNGKKSLAESIVYGAFNEIESKSKKEPVEVFEKALEEVGPKVEVKARRVGGATYQVPLEVRPSRSLALAMRWLANSAKSRSEKRSLNRPIPLLNFISRRSLFYPKNQELKLISSEAALRSSSQKSIIFRTDERNSSFEPPYERKKRFAQLYISGTLERNILLPPNIELSLFHIV